MSKRTLAHRPALTLSLLAGALSLLATAACDTSSNDENLAGYALLFGGMFVLAAVVGFIFVGVGLVAAAGGSMTLLLNVVRPPSGWSRTAGIGFGVLNGTVGIAGAVLLAFLSMPHESRGGVTQMQAPSMQSVAILVGFVALGIANVILALRPRRTALIETGRA